MVNDGHCNIDISPDGMLARATFSPATGNGHPLGIDAAEFEIRGAGLMDGVDWDLVRSSIDECNNEGRILRDVVIARGRHARPAIPSVLIFPPRIQALDPVFLPPERQEDNASFAAYFNTTTVHMEEGGHHDAGTVDEHGNIDFRETHGVVIIHKDQVLAVVRNAIEGIPGQTVRGEYVPFQTLKVNPMTAGGNTELRDGRIYSTVHGRLVWNSGSFGVDDTLELAQDVGYKTGNIRFPGNLVLKAGIKDRFKVWVGGNLDATGVVDAFEVYCGGNLSANAGIIGRGKSLVRCRGSITTRFIENCVVECLGPIRVENATLHATIYTSDSFAMSEKGRVVGGESHIGLAMEVNSIGNAAGAKTWAYLGRNYVVQRKIDLAREKYQEVMIALQGIETRIANDRNGAHPREPAHSVLEQQARLRGESETLLAELNAVSAEMVDHPEATLIVHGTCYPGVVVDICGTSLEVTKEQKNVIFVLDQSKGRVEIRPHENKTPAKAPAAGPAGASAKDA